MIVEMTRKQTIKLEGHITLTFDSGMTVDLPEDIVAQGVSEGWCKSVAVAGPAESAASGPAETKRAKAK